MSLLRCAVFSLALALAITAPQARAYSVLSHEEVVDMAWPQQIVPLLKARFPGITDDQLREAHAYAYGGSVIQDIGYYPFGSHYFSDLLHYVRPGDFVEALLHDATTADEYAFALGGLAHYCGDAVGHPYVNEVVAAENSGLRRRFGPVVTYSEDPVAHVRTEFGFDVVEVAHGIYSQENYRDFIGFQVAKPLLEKAFLEIYGIPMDHVITHEDLAIASYRRAVSSLIPKMTKVAWVSYHDEIARARPGFQRDKFIYRLRRTDFTQQYGHDYKEPGWGTHLLAFFIRILPKIGPLKSLAVSIPDSGEQDAYLTSVNEAVDRYYMYLHEMGAPAEVRPGPGGPGRPGGPSPHRPGGPPPGAQNQTAPAQPAAPSQPGAAQQPIAAAVSPAVAPSNTPAPQTQAQTAAAPGAQQGPQNGRFGPSRSGPGGGSNGPGGGFAGGAGQQGSDRRGGPRPSRLGQNSMSIAQMTVSRQDIHLPVVDGVPELPPIDLDTGKPSASGEYPLADATMARLLDQLLHDKKATITPDMRGTLIAFYENPVARNSLSRGLKNHKLWKKLQQDLDALRGSTPGLVVPPRALP